MEHLIIIIMPLIGHEHNMLVVALNLAAGLS